MHRFAAQILKLSNRQILLNLNSRRLLNISSVLGAEFSFTLNKFNDIHIKSDNVVKFSQETNFDTKEFEQTLKSK